MTESENKTGVEKNQSAEANSPQENESNMEVNIKPSQNPNASGDPGRTPGTAEGDEQTIDADIREKESEGKL